MSEPGAMSRAKAAAVLGLTRKSISNMLGTGRLRRVGRGLADRAQVEELAAARAERRRQRAAPRRPQTGRDLVDAAEAARVLDVTPQYVNRLAAADRLPYVDAGPSRRRFYRRKQLQVIAAARAAAR